MVRKQYQHYASCIAGDKGKCTSGYNSWNCVMERLSNYSVCTLKTYNISFEHFPLSHVLKTTLPYVSATGCASYTGKNNHYNFGPIAPRVSEHVTVRNLKLILQCSYVNVSKNTRLAKPFEFKGIIYFIPREQGKEE
jgi:hypothetical protein